MVVRGQPAAHQAHGMPEARVLSWVFSPSCSHRLTGHKDGLPLDRARVPITSRPRTLCDSGSRDHRRGPGQRAGASRPIAYPEHVTP
jgi:hypothetical protein